MAFRARLPVDSTQMAEETVTVHGMKDLVVRLSDDPNWARRVSQEVASGIAQELPELAEDPDFRRQMEESTAANIRLLVEMVRSGVDPGEAILPPAAVEYAREIVRRGMTIDALLRAYFIGHSTLFKLAREEIGSNVEDAEALARTIEEFATWTFSFIQTLTSGLVERYSAERERWVRSSAAVKAELIDGLLAGERLDIEATSARIRYRLDRNHLAFVAWTNPAADPGNDPTLLERAAGEIAAAFGVTDPLLLPKGGGQIFGWLGSRAEEIEPKLGALNDKNLKQLGPVTGVRVAFGTIGEELDGFRFSNQQAIEARRVALLSGPEGPTVNWYRDLALTALASSDADRAAEFCREELGPLLGADDRTQRLARTVLCYLEESGSPRRAARRLGVHENTVVNHIRSAEELLGRPLEQRVGEMIVALRLAPIVQNGNGHSHS